ncbi:hypothetical protein FDF97_15790 [Clostridium botulinum]|uniref:Uncharacterized protein n=1 Tax=Clostridium botulinum TaxID=1491 RepID=A0AA44BQZ2_CLOBO|nr:hypothetical protein [Clostridium botulinum]NFI22928.1 hypothetical protein [Clostridium botulinum]NFQ79661.1 hypothetical protein [Clostridium botulinum]
MSCKDCKKYTVSCSILEGFECCKCCGITECKYDICPPKEKIVEHTITIHEYHASSDISWAFNDISNAKNAFLEKRFTKSYYNNAKHAYKEFKDLKRNIEVDENIRPYMKKKFLNRIELGILCCKDLNRQILYALGKCEKKTTYNYFKRHLSKFSAKTIGKNRILSSVEKEKLIRRKGIDNPLPFI